MPRLSDTDSDDSDLFNLPGTGSHGAGSAASAPVRRPSPTSSAPPAPVLEPREDDNALGAPPPPASSRSGGSTDATLALLAQRKAMRGRGRGGTGRSPVGRSPTVDAVDPLPGSRRSSPVVRTASPTLSDGSPPPPSQVPAGREEPRKPPLREAEPVVELPAEPVRSPVAPRSPSPPAVSDEAIEKLRALVREKKELVAAASQREKTLEAQREVERQRHQDSVMSLQREGDRLWQDVEAARTQHQRDLADVERECEDEIRRVRQQTEDAAAAEYDPKIQEATLRISELQREKSAIEGSMKLESNNRSVIDAAVTQALKSIVEKMDVSFREEFSSDEAWEGEVQARIKDEVTQSFVHAADDEFEAERSEHLTAFREMLDTWRRAEDEERGHVLKTDEQLLADLQQMAHTDLDRLQREELSLQQAFMSGREQWMQSHREGLQDEVRAAVERRAVEFEEMRKQQRQIFAERLALLEQRHADDLARDKEQHERKLTSVRASAAARQQLHEERQRAARETAHDAEQAVSVLKDVIAGVSSTLDTLDQYSRSVDSRREEVEKERVDALTQREAALSDVQRLVLGQASAVEQERRALAATVAKLEVVQGSLDKQLEEDRSWASQTTASLERSRGEWEREYRRWQHVAAQERRAAEQRFSDVLLELRNASHSLDEERQRLAEEGTSLRQRADERAQRAGHEAAAMSRREEELQSRYDAMLKLTADLEARSKQMSEEWQRLHLSRQDLARQREEFVQEEARMRHTEEQLRHMRHVVDAAHTEGLAVAERAKHMQHQVSASQDIVGLETEGVQRQVQQLARSREALQAERSGLTAIAREKALHHRPQPRPRTAALPRQVLGELHQQLQRSSHPESSVSDPTSQPSDTRFVDPSQPTMHFTRLVGVSDADTMSGTSAGFSTFPRSSS